MSEMLTPSPCRICGKPTDDFFGCCSEACGDAYNKKLKDEPPKAETPKNGNSEIPKPSQQYTEVEKQRILDQLRSITIEEYRAADPMLKNHWARVVSVPVTALDAMAELLVKRAKSEAKKASSVATDAVDYTTAAPGEPPYILEGLIFEGTVTQLLGVIKSGKSTWLFTFLRNLLDGKPFMGQKTVATNVLYVSEQPRASLASQMIEAGLNKRFTKKLFVLDISQLWHLPWSDTITKSERREGRASAIRRIAEEVEAGLVIIDTFPRLAMIKEMASIGEMNEAFESIAPVTSDGRTLVLGWHERKAGGMITEAAAGTAASGGAMDMLIRIQRIPGAKLTDRTRSLEATGRFASIAGDGIAIELSADRSDYNMVGEAELAVKRNVEFDIQKILKNALPNGLTRTEITEILRERAGGRPGATPPSKTSILRALDGLIETEFIRHEGKGTRTDPLVFFSTEIKGNF